jgi:hypothetical protein
MPNMGLRIPERGGSAATGYKCLPMRSYADHVPMAGPACRGEEASQFVRHPIEGPGGSGVDDRIRAFLHADDSVVSVRILGLFTVLRAPVSRGFAARVARTGVGAQAG